MISALTRFVLDNRPVVWLGLLAVVAWGLAVAPFDFGVPGLPRDPVAVDAIPDLGENQQIVFTPWPGRSPQDVEDQITYPLTSALLGVPGVRSVRSSSLFGLSSIYLIFEEDVEFYWSRSRVLEKLNALPAGTLPEGVAPGLGPDATALGQVFWYTLEGRDPVTGEPAGGWDLHELRAIQDFQVKYALSAAAGVAEVASVGGYVKEYQVDVDPDALRAYGLGLADVMRAVRGSNQDVGAATLEINFAEYFVRGLGYLESVADLEASVISARDNVPVTLGDVARVNIGPAARRGALDKSGAEAVGGVVVARYGANPLAVIDDVKAQIAQVSAGLPTRTLPDGTVSRVTVVPFYDRSTLIYETLGTLEEALTLEVLVTVIVVLLMLLNLRASLLVAGTLPVAVLMCFIAMRYLGVDANIVALSGIAIAIGTMVDVGIVLTESILLRLQDAKPGANKKEIIHEATVEVGSAVLTAVATTVISFLPVFTMVAAEGKLFRPLAFTKTFALVAAIVVGLVVIPVLAYAVLRVPRAGADGSRAWWRRLGLADVLLVVVGVVAAYLAPWWLAAGAIGLGLLGVMESFASTAVAARIRLGKNVALAALVAFVLAEAWVPLGVQASALANFLAVGGVIALLVGTFWGVIVYYADILRLLLRFKAVFLALIVVIVYLGVGAWRGLGEEFMPALDEGSFLLMPTSMPHAGVQENLANLRALDMAVTTIPEVATVVGKAGRANTALDPAPMSMYENVITYLPEYRTDAAGRRLRFAVDDGGAFLRDDDDQLVPDPDGRYFRQWRDHIESPDDIWEEITRVAKLPGVTSAPRLQPIETRLVMLQTGMRAPMGIKVSGTDLGVVEDFGFRLEEALREVPGVRASAVYADRIVGKPYLLLDIRRDAAARYGLSVADVQTHIQAAVGGVPLTTTVEGRERFDVRLRYPRELRDDPESLRRILVATPTGTPVPLGDLVDVRYEQGPQAIKSEDGFLVGYVLFDREPGTAEVEVVRAAQAYLEDLIATGDLAVPAGVSYRFAGTYEQQVRASNTLALVVPIALALIFLILYFQFRSVPIALMVFSGVAVAFAGGFLMLAAYGESWFLDFELSGVNLRDVLQVRPVNLSVAVWVGFLALFGIATDDGVLVATFLRDSFRQNEPTTVAEVRAAVVEGGLRRVRPAMMTTATTILALLPVLTSSGRGADIMIPMAIPSFGGMALQVVTMFTVPVLFSAWKEGKLRWRGRGRGGWARASALLAVAVGVPVWSTAQASDSTAVGLLSDHPELRALELEYRAELSRAGEVGQLPEVELGLGVFAVPVETRVGPQRLRLSATQMLPWPGVLEAQRKLAAARAAPLAEAVDARALELRYRFRENYLRLAATAERARVLREQVELYAGLEGFALARVEAGAGSSVNVYRIQLRRQALANRLDVLALEAAELRVALERLAGAGVAAPDSLPAAPAALAPGAPDSTHPRLRALALQGETVRRSLDLTALERRPDFAVGLDYIGTGQRGLPELTDDGKDAVLARVGLRIALDRSGYRARETTDHLRLGALDARAADLTRELTAEAELARLAAATARENLAFYQRQLDVLAAALTVATDEYAQGSRGFEELLELAGERLDIGLAAVAARTQLLTAAARLERALATDLNR